MATLRFFAIKEDMIKILEFLYSETDVHIFEDYSNFNEELKEFTKIEEILESYDLGVDKQGTGYACSLRLWSPKVIEKPLIELIKLNPTKSGECQFRYCINAIGLIQIEFGGICENIITKSYLGYLSEKGAENRGHISFQPHINICNWTELKKLSNKLQYHIKRRLSSNTVPGHPILNGAYKNYAEGFILEENRLARWSYSV